MRGRLKRFSIVVERVGGLCGRWFEYLILFSVGIEQFCTPHLIFTKECILL